MTAADVIEAIRLAHPAAAIVTEVALEDPEWLDDFQPGVSKSSRRIDALMFRTLERTAIEVKISKADFDRDYWEKRRPWVRITHRFIYAVPAGLIERPPYGCGLWWVDEQGHVEVKAKAKINRTPEPLPQQVVQALAYRAARTQPRLEAMKA